MRNFLSFCLLLMLGFALAPEANGQGCAVTMQAHYSTYATASSDGTNIHTSVLTDGYATGAPSAGCPLNGVTHTPKSYNVLKTTGGWGAGSPGCVTCNITYQNDQQIVGSLGANFTWVYTGSIICSKVGAFWASPTINAGLAIHKFWYSWYGFVTGRTDEAWYHRCIAGTTYQSVCYSIVIPNDAFVGNTFPPYTSVNMLVLQIPSVPPTCIDIWPPSKNTACLGPDS
jgi:hypothetical protein